MYKIKKPKNTFYLQVDDINKIYVKQYGNLNGIPVIHLHGGPGGFSTDKITKMYNLKYFNLICIDQRGCGKSKPHLSIKDNNTDNIIEDIEKVRKELKIKKFIITGGSWGATLSLLYAIKYPKNILSYIVSSGCFFVSKGIWPECIFTMYPDKWDTFCSMVNIPKKDIENPSTSIQKKICNLYFNKIKNRQQKYINSWYNFEHDLVYTVKKNNNKSKGKLDLAFYESYYYSKNFFRPNHYVEDNCNKIKNIKGYFLHGRLDIICDFKESYVIHKKLPKSVLFISDFEGHGGDVMKQKNIEILNELAKKYFNKRNSFYLST